jgi:hypothetical protein
MDQIAVNDNPVEAVIDEDQEFAEQLGEGVHRSAPANGRSKPDRAKLCDRRRLRYANEIRYIQRRAAARDGRVVTADPLVLFSTETAEAGLLDPSDHLAAGLARDGDPESVAFEVWLGV